jgi:ubiquinone/menaquinone biosynthesis C-methylase UbiE
MGWWTDHVVPRLADRSLSTAEVQPLRARACSGLTGRVLEVGFGSGLNVAHYPAAVREVQAVEPSDVAWRMALPRIAAGAVPVVRAGLDGRRLAGPTDSVDSVLSTFTLCTIPDVGAALAELRRVLRPAGSLHFAEHGRSPDASVARWQDRLQPVYGPAAGGCHLTRQIDRLLADAGFVIADLDTFYLPGPAPSKPFGYCFVGRAHVVP